MLCFSPDFCSLPCHVLFCGGDTSKLSPTLPQVVFNSLILFVWGVSAKISDLNFQANHVRAQLKKFTKKWTKAFVLLEVVFYVYVKRKSKKKVFVKDSMSKCIKMLFLFILLSWLSNELLWSINKSLYLSIYLSIYIYLSLYIYICIWMLNTKWVLEFYMSWSVLCWFPWYKIVLHFYHSFFPILDFCCASLCWF